MEVMKKVNMKKIVFWASGIGGGLFIFLLLSLLYGFCGSYRHVCKDIYTPIAYLFFSFPFLFLLSLITYKMRDEVFRAWWSFVRWWVPVIIVTTLLLNSAGGDGGGGMGGGGLASGMLDFAVLVLLYAILVIVSFFRIVRAYRKK